MSDYISRHAAITAIDNYGCDGEDSCGEPWIYMENAVEAIEMVEPLPSAQPERIRGRWEVASTGYSGFMRCSACKAGCCGDYRSMNFCPNCGADMRGEGVKE